MDDYDRVYREFCKQYGFRYTRPTTPTMSSDIVFAAALGSLLALGVVLVTLVLGGAQ